MEEVVKRFLDYVKIDTQSDETKQSTPTTDKQYNFAQKLAEELKEIGLKKVTLDQNGYLMATLAANTDQEIPTIGFIAHLDTSPDYSGKNINPKIITNYNGNNILLNAENNIELTPAKFPELKKYTSQDLIVTNGTTLLGADDKAGIAEIITAIHYLIKHPEIKHGKIKICFTPDEEVGRGADHFDVKKFGAEFAFTIDGGEIGELEYENFNAASAEIKIKGINVHPGTAKDKMVNSMLIASKLINSLPSKEIPEHTEKYEGFYHLLKIDGEVENTYLKYIIRDFSEENFAKRKTYLKDIVGKLNQEYGAGTVELKLKDQYYNMREKIETKMEIIELAKKAMEKANLKPKLKPIRGGTDGARLSFMGLPTPNLFTGGHNFHGKFEFIPIESMLKSVEVIVNIAQLNAEKN